MTPIVRLVSSGTAIIKFVGPLEQVEHIDQVEQIELKNFVDLRSKCLMIGFEAREISLFLNKVFEESTPWPK